MRPEESKLTISVESKDDYIKVSSFMKIVEGTLDILREIEHQIVSDGKDKITWRVSEASLNSPLTLTIFPDTSEGEEMVGREVVAAYIQGINHIDRETTPPKHFTVSSLEKTKTLVSSLRGAVSAISYSSPIEPIKAIPTLRVVRHINKILQNRPSHYYDTGSIEGRLETLNIHNRDLFIIYGDRYKKGIRCTFLGDKLKEDARQAFGKRVSVFGRIKYDRLRQPEMMQARTIKQLRERNNLPTLDDLGPIDLSDGMDSADYVRSLRDGD